MEIQSSVGRSLVLFRAGVECICLQGLGFSMCRSGLGVGEGDLPGRVLQLHGNVHRTAKDAHIQATDSKNTISAMLDANSWDVCSVRMSLPTLGSSCFAKDLVTALPARDDDCLF
jgi:hypothetical protein